MAPRQQGLSAFLKGSSTKKHQSEQESQSHSKRRKSDLFVRGGDASRFGTCPLCNANLPLHLLEAHAEQCMAEETAENESLRQDQKSFGLSSSSEETSRFEACPICSFRFPMHLLIAHCDGCTGPSASKEKKKDHKTDPEKDSKPLSKKAEKNSTAASERKDDSQIPWWKQAKQGKTRIDNPLLPSSEPIPGLYLFENIITEEEEQTILAELDGTCHDFRHEFLPWKHAKFNGSHNGKRWGVHCNLRDRRVSAPEHAMPHFFHSFLFKKLKRIEAMAGCIPNEANAIDYRRKEGHWLQSHVDDRQLSKEPIANLSIAGDCFMTFRNDRISVEERVLLKRQTLQILTGKARYDYAHGIHNEDLLSDRRVSITMRESPLTKPKK